MFVLLSLIMPARDPTYMADFPGFFSKGILSRFQFFCHFGKKEVVPLLLKVADGQKWEVGTGKGGGKKRLAIGGGIPQLFFVQFNQRNWAEHSEQPVPSSFSVDSVSQLLLFWHPLSGHLILLHRIHSASSAAIPFSSPSLLLLIGLNSGCRRC